MPTYGLSKSKILAFLQCPKRLYLQVHHPKLAEDSAEAQRQFQTGHKVGELARTLVPGGILIGHDDNLAQALVATREALQQFPRKALFEATFAHKGVLVRADVLIPGKNGYRLREVKASTSVKDYYLQDCTVQSWVLAGAGIKLEQTSVSYVNNTFVYAGNNDYRGLLKDENITEQTRALEKQPAKWVKGCHEVLAGKLPKIGTGDHCSTPYPCPFMEHCMPPQPDYPVTCLPYGKSIATELLEEGIEDIRDIPEGRLTKDNHIRVRRVTISGKAELAAEAADELCGLSYPRHYLDFETISFAIPLWTGTRPYQQLPFQWSCHHEAEDGEIHHTEFLDTSGNAPMRSFAESLLKTVGKKGPVFVYSHFEKTRIEELVIMFPDLAAALNKLLKRLVDLLPIARAHYYHPDMKGSWSIKSVLPTIAPELDYENLDEVQDGGGAQSAYLEIIDPQTPEERRTFLTAALLEYCGQDTLALVKVAHFFQK